MELKKKKLEEAKKINELKEKALKSGPLCMFFEKFFNKNQVSCLFFSWWRNQEVQRKEMRMVFQCNDQITNMNVIRSNKAILNI
jgi:hypothetical protein